MKGIYSCFLKGVFFFTFCFLAVNPSTFGQSVSPKKFKKCLVKQEGVLLDVRTPEEYNEEHLMGALNINVKEEDFKSRVDTLDKSKAYFIYCKAGKRSQQAVEIMKEAGFKKLYQLKGGIDDWKEKGYEVERK